MFQIHHMNNIFTKVIFPDKDVPSLSIRIMQENSSIIKEDVTTYIDCADQPKSLFYNVTSLTIWRKEEENSCQYHNGLYLYYKLDIQAKNFCSFTFV